MSEHILISFFTCTKNYKLNILCTELIHYIRYKVKTLQVPAKLGFEIGEEVDIVLKRTMGLKAVWLAYVLPLILMVAVLLALTALGLSELTAGLCAIAAVGLWYLVLWLMRDKLKNEYTFYIKKK